MHFVTSCLRYISGKYYPNWSGFSGIIAEMKRVTFLRHTVVAGEVTVSAFAIARINNRSPWSVSSGGSRKKYWGGGGAPLLLGANNG